MKLWIIHQDAGTPFEYGYHRHYEIALRLSARGHDVTVVASAFNHKSKSYRVEVGDALYLRDEVGGVPFVWLDSPPYTRNDLRRIVNFLAFPRNVLRLPHDFGSGRPDVIVGSSPSLFAASAALTVANRRRVPFVLEVRDLHPDTIVELGRYPVWHPGIVAMRRLEKRLYRQAAGAISNLPFAIERMRELGYGMDKPFAYAPNGVGYDARALSYQPPPEKPDGHVEILYVGSHGTSNHLDILIDAMARLVGAGTVQKRICLTFVGDGPDKPRLIERVASEGLTDRISFEDPIPQSAVHERCLQADAFVISVAPVTLYRYGIGANKFYEFMAAGRPVLSVSSARNDPVSEAGCGLTVPAHATPGQVAEAMIKLGRMTEETRRSMGERGIIAVRENFTYDAVTDEIERLLCQVLA